MLFLFIFSLSCYATEHVIAISIDGLSSEAVKKYGETTLPTLYYFMHHGASTLNARNDDDYTNTLPNHTSMLTGHPVLGKNGHFITHNKLSDKKIGEKRYIYSIFNVLSQHHYTSAFVASKAKFRIYQATYKNHITHIGIYNNDREAIKRFLTILQTYQPQFSFLHLRSPDSAGHKYGWLSNQYKSAVQYSDANLAKILKLINHNKKFKHQTIIIITSDHGGHGKGHSNATDPKNYTIPFIVWGNGVAKNADLYQLNRDIRRNPKGRGYYQKQFGPIRNSDLANLSLQILSLPAIPSSSIGAKQNLKLA